MSKKGIFLLAILLAMLGSCKKETDEEVIPPPEPPLLCNDAYYHDFSPDTVFPMPYLSTDSFCISVNQDTVTDIIFSLSHHIESVGPHPYDAYIVEMMFADSLQYVETGYGSGPCQTPLALNTTIDGSSALSLQFVLYYCSPQLHLDCNSFTEPGFVGFRLHQSGQDYYGWIRLKVNSSELTIDDFAVCNCAGTGISIGTH